LAEAAEALPSSANEGRESSMNPVLFSGGGAYVSQVDVDAMIEPVRGDGFGPR
jgi:hypothetical protein